jgi:hypothetical protein
MVSAPAAALDAEFRVMPNGTAYLASIQTSGGEYGFWNSGMLGERIPQSVEDLQVTGASGPVEYRWKDAGTVTFPDGNYSIRYRAPIRNNYLQASFDEPYTVTVLLPPGLDVRNPLLGMISPGGTITAGEDGSVEVAWDRARSMEIRFYDPDREILLNTFGTIWLVVAVVLILPYIVSRRGRE